MQRHRTGRGNALRDGHTVLSRRPIDALPGNTVPVDQADEENAFSRQYGGYRERRDREDPNLRIPEDGDGDPTPLDFD